MNNAEFFLLTKSLGISSVEEIQRYVPDPPLSRGSGIYTWV